MPPRAGYSDRTHEPFLDPVGACNLGVGVSESKQGGEPGGRFLAEVLLAHEQHAAGSVERVTPPAAMAELFGLDAAADLVEAAVGEGDEVEGVDDLSGGGEGGRVDGGVGARHVEGAEADPLAPTERLVHYEAGDGGVLAGGQDIDDLVVLDVAHGGRVVTLSVAREMHERGLVQAYGAGVVEPSAVRLQQRTPVGGDGLVHRVPVTAQLKGHLGDGPSPSDQDRRPLRRPRREPAVLGRDAVVGEHEAPLRTPLVGAVPAVLAPGQVHRRAVDGKVDIADHRTLLHPCRATAGRASHLGQGLFDHELHLAATALEMEDANILQADHGLEDLGSVADDEGASGL